MDVASMDLIRRCNCTKLATSSMTGLRLAAGCSSGCI